MISRRIPHGMRGLKSASVVRYCVNLRRIPHGMRGLKSCYRNCPLAPSGSRIPHGMRGLKFAAHRLCK